MGPRRIAPRDGDCDLFENDEGFDPCDAGPDGLCHGSTKEQCTCSSILYLVWASCDACLPKPKNTTWDDYSNRFDCTGLPQQFPPPLPTGDKAFPAWAAVMAFATPEPTVFNLAAASSFILGPSSTSISTPVPTTAGSTTTAQQAQLSAHRNSFPAGAIAGIVVGICLMVSVAVFICLRLRRHRQQRQPEATGDISPISPYTADTLTPGAWDAEAKFGATRRTAPPELHSSNTSFHDAPSVPSNPSPASEAPLVPIRRPDPQRESRTSQQKTDLVEEWLSSTSLAHPGPAGRNARALSIAAASNAGAAAVPADFDPDVVLQLRAMTARVRELEAQVESPPLVYASPGTPPPGYSGAGRSSTRVSRQS